MTKCSALTRVITILAALMMLCGLCSGETIAVTTDGLISIPVSDVTSAMVSGILVDGNGTRLAGARVSFTSASGDVITLTTDPAGKWTAGSLQAGVYTVSAALDDQSLVSGRKVTVRAGADMNLRLSAQQGTASAVVCVFDDRSKNGEMNSSETVLKDVLVELLYVDGAEEQLVTSAVTDTGNLTFSALPAGTYRLRVTLPERYGFSPRKTKSPSLTLNMMSQSTDRVQTSADLTLTNGASLECAVGAMPMSGISGTIWLDVNGDGLLNNEELGLSGVKVEMTGTKNGLTYSCTTDSTGMYRFTQLKPGSYTLKVSLPEGYIFTRKADKGNGSLFTADGESVGQSKYNLNEPQMLTEQNVGALPTASVTVRSFVDNNHNGLWDEGEKAMSGLKVELGKNGSSNVIKTLTTGSDGSVTFTGLRNDTYRIRTVLPDNSYDYTLVVDGGNRVSDAGNREGALRGIQVGVGEAVDVLVGSVKPGSISGMVYKDENYSGTRDGKDSAGQYVSVNLLNEEGKIIASTKTGKDGQYSFGSVYPGRYRVSFSTSSKYGFLTAGKGTSVTSNGKGVGTTDLFELALSERKTGINAALITPCSVATRVWADLNNNGQYDVGETGLSNATVVLQSKTFRFEMKPTGNGRCAFNAVPPGEYTLSVILPEQDSFVNDIPSAYSLSADGRTATTKSFKVSLDKVKATAKPGETVKKAKTTQPHKDVVIPAIGGTCRTPVSGVFYIDSNANGIIDEGEQALSGAVLTVTSEAGQSQTVVSGADGRFSMESLPTGTYTFTMDLPDGWMISRTRNITMPIVPEDTHISVRVELGVGVDWSNQQLGVVHPASLSGMMWMDENSNGAFDDTEPGPAGRELQVIDLRSGELYVTLTTGSDGVFRKDNMLPGEYQLIYKMDGFCTPIFGDNMSFETDGKDTLTYDGIVLKGNDSVSGLKLGLHSYTSIGGIIWQDVNGTILPLPGRTVRLMDASGAVISTAVSAEDGHYSFDWLSAGRYCVDVSVPDGQIMVKPDDWRITEGLCDSGMSYVSGTYGRSDIIELRMGRHMLKESAGAVSLGNLGDLCWLDLNGNGLKDSGEEGIPNVTIQLLDKGNVIAETVTDQYGYYRFTDLYPGSYVLHVIHPGEVIPTVFRDDYAGVTSVMQEEGIDSFEVHVTSGGHNYNADVGFRQINGAVYPEGYGEGARQNWK